MNCDKRDESSHCLAHCHSLQYRLYSEYSGYSQVHGIVQIPGKFQYLSEIIKMASSTMYWTMMMKNVTRLSSTKQVRIRYSRFGPNQTSLRHFIRNHLAPLKVHNENVEFIVEKPSKDKNEPRPHEIIIEHVNGNKSVVDTATLKTASDVLHKLVEIDKSIS